MDFSLNVPNAIRDSLNSGKPLLVLIDDGRAFEWFQSRFNTPSTVHFVESMVIRLKILYDSQDYTNLSQFTPQITRLGSCGVVVVFRGHVLLEISGDTSISEIDKLVVELVGKMGNQHLQKGNGGEDKRAFYSNSQNQTQTQTQTQPPAHTQNDIKPETVVSKLIKEESKSAIPKKMKSKSTPIPSPKQKIIPTTCLLQLKLLDGSTIRHEFPIDDKLHSVRSFVLESQPEYNDYHFYFFKPIERLTLGEADELKSLRELDLNMSTLILKLVDPQESQTNEIIPSSSPLNWMKSAWNSLWAPQDQQPNSDSTPLSSTSNNGYPGLEFNEEDGEESDAASFHSVMTPPLRPNLSSFSLYGSQGLISSSSLRTMASTPTPTQQIPISRERNRDRDRDRDRDNDIKDLDQRPGVGNGNNVTLQRPNP